MVSDNTPSDKHRSRRNPYEKTSCELRLREVVVVKVDVRIGLLYSVELFSEYWYLSTRPIVEEARVAQNKQTGSSFKFVIQQRFEMSHNKCFRNHY